MEFDLNYSQPIGSSLGNFHKKPLKLDFWEIPRNNSKPIGLLISNRSSPNDSPLKRKGSQCHYFCTQHYSISVGWETILHTVLLNFGWVGNHFVHSTIGFDWVGDLLHTAPLNPDQVGVFLHTTLQMWKVPGTGYKKSPDFRPTSLHFFTSSFSSPFKAIGFIFEDGSTL